MGLYGIKSSLMSQRLQFSFSREECVTFGFPRVCFGMYFLAGVSASESRRKLLSGVVNCLIPMLMCSY